MYILIVISIVIPLLRFRRTGGHHPCPEGIGISRMTVYRNGLRDVCLTLHLRCKAVRFVSKIGRVIYRVCRRQRYDAVCLCIVLCVRICIVAEIAFFQHVVAIWSRRFFQLY